MNRKIITSRILNNLVDHAIIREAEEDNIEIGRALKDISEGELKKILGVKKKKRSYNKLILERVIWSISVAALIAVAICLPIGIENRSKDEIDNLLYAYNASELSAMESSVSRSAGMVLPNITAMTDDELKEILPELQRYFEESSTSQDITVNGKILALSYIRLHKREEAREILKIMIDKLSADEDYGATVKECHNLLEQIK